MSDVVCGKRSLSVFFSEEQQSSPLLHHHQAKRFRSCSSLSPPPPPFVHNTSTIGAVPLDQLRSIFPNMDQQLLERVLEASGNDLDLAIRSLSDMHLESAEENIACIATASETDMKTSVQLLGDVDAYCAANAHSAIPGSTIGKDGKEEAVSPNSAYMEGLPRNGSEWVEVLVREMMNASDVEDAKARTSRVLDVLEKSIIANASRAEAMQENMLLKEQVETLSRENNVLKRAVAIQHERQKEYEGKTQEVLHLKQLASQYQEQLAKLEVSNYALSMHLRQAQQSNSIPGRFNPDVF